MSKRVRITAIVTTLCLCLSLFVIGVLSATTATLNVTSTLRFEADGVYVMVDASLKQGASVTDADVIEGEGEPTGQATYTAYSYKKATDSNAPDGSASSDTFLQADGTTPAGDWAIGDIYFTSQNIVVVYEFMVYNYSPFEVQGTVQGISEALTTYVEQGQLSIVTYTGTDSASATATGSPTYTFNIPARTSTTEPGQACYKIAVTLKNFMSDLATDEIEMSVSFEEYEIKPVPEPVYEYFTYSGGAITGLSDEYKSLEVKPETLIIPSTDGEGNKITTISGTSGMIEIVFPFEDLESSNIIIEEGITTIGREAFASCVSITSVTIPSTITAWEPTVDASLSGYNNAFSDCVNLSNITLAEGLTTLGDYAFNNCTSLTSVTIPSSVSSFGTHIFNGCTNLESISLTSSENLLNIHGDSTFEGCSNIINEENNVEYLINTTENGVDKYLIAVGFATEEVTTVEINPNCKYLAFGLCSSNRNITSISLPTGLIGIGAWAFANCTDLTNITIPEGITSIKTSTFSNCSALTNITLPSTLTNIESSAFSHCDSLVSITIPEKVVSIGRNTFFPCDNLKNVTFADPNNWRVYESSSDETGIGLTLSTSSSAARYLKSTYRMYTWKKL